MREVVLDTETTGLEVTQGHRVIEIGCVEILNRRLTGKHFHCYVHPDREIEPEAVKIHGITGKFLADKPRFEAIADEFLEFVRGARLVIHNAPFDLGFLNRELSLLNRDLGRLEDSCQILDTLAVARRTFPGKKASLDALCKRLGVDNSHRDLHGALLDAEILGDVYLAMSSGQATLALDASVHLDLGDSNESEAGRLGSSSERAPLRVIRADELEQQAHERFLDMLADACGGASVWRANKMESRK